MTEIGKLVVEIDFDTKGINFDVKGLKVQLNPKEVMQVINPFILTLWVNGIRQNIEKEEAKSGIIVPMNRHAS